MTRQPKHAWPQLCHTTACMGILCIDHMGGGQFGQSDKQEVGGNLPELGGEPLPMAMHFIVF